MMVMRLLNDLFRRVRDEWDITSRISLIIALILLILALVFLFLGPAQVRDGATIGVVGLIVTTQVIILWGNRTMVKPYTQAQRHYLAGEFQAARDILLEYLLESETDADAFTLLGNTYRQLGDLEASAAALEQALSVRPQYHFPLYGLGRTLQVSGRYAESIPLIENALSAGAPSVVKFDIGHSLYRLNEIDRAVEVFNAVRSLLQDPHRVLMVEYILYRYKDGNPPASTVIRAGLSYWQAEVNTFANTPYGEALREDVRLMQNLMKEA